MAQFILNIISRNVRQGTIEVTADNLEEARGIFEKGDIDFGDVTDNGDIDDPLWELDNSDEKTFNVLIRHYDEVDPSKQFTFSTVVGRSREEALEVVDESLLNSDSQAWVLTDDELTAFKTVLI